jgi:hypothetical protein
MITGTPVLKLRAIFAAQWMYLVPSSLNAAATLLYSFSICYIKLKKKSWKHYPEVNKIDMTIWKERKIELIINLEEDDWTTLRYKKFVFVHFIYNPLHKLLHMMLKQTQIKRMKLGEKGRRYRWWEETSSKLDQIKIYLL